MKTLPVLFLTFIALLPCSQARNLPDVWAYLMKGEEKYFPASSPITDVACFSASVDADGNLSGGHLSPPAIGPNASTRFHLVITMPWNTSLAHIYLDPALPFRNRIIADIVERSKPFDGIQIDFESIDARDGTAYLNFLSSVKKALPSNKEFSVAVLPRWAEHKKKHPNDAFDYPFINMVADRIIVMAYDEHYRGGSAGPIASLDWCKKIHDYALKTIDPDKLIMGIPLYGRSWQREKTAQAFRNREVWTDLRIREAEVSSSAKTGGHYSYTTNVNIDVYFENLPSLDAKIETYEKSGLQGIAFWRISQEPIGFWDHLLTSRTGTKK